MKTPPVLLLICDGWGHAPPSPGNAITLARTPIFDRWLAEHPWTLLEASGEAVGLPAGVMGNSEVGHLTLGAGRMVPQDLLRIDLALRDGSFFANAALTAAMEHARRRGSTLHLMGLVSDGGVHSHLRHLEGLLELAARAKVPRVRVHVFTDGRDTPPRSALGYLERLEAALERLGGRIATVSGRYYAMDRDRRWDRVARAYQALVFSSGLSAESPAEAVRAAYARGESDEFIQPTVILDGDSPAGPIQDGDTVVFFNFRADRARQITRALTEAGFADFPRPKPPKLHVVCFTEYKEDFRLPVAFTPQALVHILADVWAAAGVSNLRLAETEKYAHVTYFFNGGVEEPYPGEERLLVPSWKGATYDLHPEMSAAQITEEAVVALRGGRFGASVVNFANADMVGHTGKLAETIVAVETLDRCFGILEAACREAGVLLLVTADHGNAEQMIDPVTGAPHTAHTTNPVPFVVCGTAGRLADGGTLADVAPTLLGLQNLPIPAEMTGRDLRRGR
ncbi:MAG TPA: 2,3-bisphosphoglycerate-independent phosphoglycerate mutase [Thermoanaerobaculia bacterium]|nr:2,3-bisphosphoglycerate-independent phosphoglycerate mutase [Thermoanaerobaculia bacterium]